jgi:hypothetical protein
MNNLFFRVLLFPVYLLRNLFSAPGKLLSSGKRVLGISLPARAAILVAVFLVICAVVSLFAFANQVDKAGHRTPFLDSLTSKLYYILSEAVLIVVIPVVVYYALKLWLAGDVSPYEDIDKAWQAGMAALEQQGLDITQVPVFLIVGSAGEAQEKALFAASRLSLNFREVPQGPAALHWYANPDAIYIVATNTSGSSRLAALARAAAEEEKSRPAGFNPRPAAGASIRGTIVAGGPEPEESPITQSGTFPGGPEPATAPSADIRGTMVASVRSSDSLGGAGQGAAPSHQAVTLRPEDAADQDRRLEYLCSLVRRARQPICPLNGVLALLPFGLIQHGPREGIEIQRALKRDLATIVRVGKVRCPVTALVIGMEEEAGFRELVRRVGRDRSAAQRFGKGFSVSNPPLPERLEAVCAHACGAFEDWVYALFREKDSLSKPGNVKLYALLCTIRRNVQLRLGNILVGAFGADPEQAPQGEPLLFSGCYFAAAGETDDRQAFVKGVFDKLPDEQAELQWTEAGKREDAKYQRLSQFVSTLDFLVLASLVGIIVYLFVRK